MLAPLPAAPPEGSAFLKATLSGFVLDPPLAGLVDVGALGASIGTTAPSELPSTSAITACSGDVAREDKLLDVLRRVELLGISAPPLGSPPDGSA